ncbi:trichohyalin-like [Drosophila serrata]|uniref:trichohyalin-like n=1 Tax=Drosophila serrata TaxID=7274 RepID=UPI000A1D25DA|nr:trichohyalin-like [Drosophila serrata]
MPKRSRYQLSRNSTQARASKIRRNEESSSETENRLSIHRQYVAQSRARESSTERSQRLAEQNMRTAQIRARESSLQRSQRLAEQNVRTSRVRERESSLERLQRIAQQNLRTSQVRAQESSNQRLQRVEEQNIRNIQSRNRESSSERFQRLQDNRERQKTLRARSRNQASAHSKRSAFRYDPQIDYAHQSSIQIGDMNKICPKCSAKKWVDETNGMCCASGKVSLPSIQEPPQPIKNLLKNNHSLSRHFITNIQGQVYHLIGSLLPPPGQNPQYLQVYFISEADQLSLRSNIAPTLKINLINELQTTIRQS